MNRYSLHIAIIAAVTAAAHAQPPAWWFEGDPPPITAAAAENNRGPANIGQAKWMARSALEALKLQAPQIAADVESALVGPGKPIPTWTPPAPGTPTAESQHSPLRIGQLKAIAAPFYSHLHTAAPTWLAAQRALNGTESGGVFPWTDAAGDDDNRAPATVGQLKAVFSLRFGNLATFDSDGDGLADLLEIEYGLDPTDDGSGDPANGPLGDADGDGLANGEDAHLGSEEIDWERAPEYRYAVVKLDPDPTGNPGAAVDLNDEGDVLFAHGIWSGGNWNPREPEDIEGSWEEFGWPMTYNVRSWHWWHFNSAKSLAGSAWMEVHGGGVDAPVGGSWPSDGDATWLPQKEYPGMVDSYEGEFTRCTPIGIADSGRVFQLRERYLMLPFRIARYLNTYDPADDGETSYTLPTVHGEVAYRAYCGAVSPTGWAAAQTATEATEEKRFMEVWNPQLDSVAMPAEANAELREPSFAELPDGRVLLAAWDAEAGKSRTFISNDQDGMDYISDLEDDTGGPVVAGDGTQMAGNRLWRNGSHHLLRDLSERLADLEDDGYDFRPIDANRHGAYLVQADSASATEYFLLLPVEVVELSPKVKDEEGNEIAGSEKPNQGEPLTPFVEEDPHANRIAHRELKVRIGEKLKGKEVTWTIEPLFVPHYDPNGPNLPPVFRGEWSDSPVAAHQNAFEASSAYGANGFEIESGEGEDAVAKTTIADDGFTAIRVNVPPIGFNQARIRIQIEGTDEPINLIDMEVPGVVIIDPGHGGTDSGTEGRTDNDIREADLALAYGLDLKTDMAAKFKAEKRNFIVFITRKVDEKKDNADRAKLARNKGADVFVSVHFNSSTIYNGKYARGTEYVTRSTGQVNASEDAQLGASVQSVTLAAVQASDPAGKHRGFKSGGFAVLSDTHYGNTAGYHPIRGTIIEVEFLSNEAALNTVKLSNASGLAIKTKFAADVATSIFNNILNHQ